MKVGVLALQGDVPEHRRALEPLTGAGSVVLVRNPQQLRRVGALVLPGGESTTISQLLDDADLRAPLLERIRDGLPVLATCAGLILLSRGAEPEGRAREPTTLGVLDVTVRRNDYGRQRESFESPVEVQGLGQPPFPGVFIRAPRILSVGPGAQSIAHLGEDVVGVRSGKIWGLTFHPELSGDPRLHARFLSETSGWVQRTPNTASETRNTTAPTTAMRT